MKRTVFSLILLLAATTVGQTENTAPIMWERYGLMDKISVLLPKLPTMLLRRGYCHEAKMATYYAYAEGVVYEVTVWAKDSTGGPIVACPKPIAFGDRLIDWRLESLREGGATSIETRSVVRGSETYILKSPGSTRLLVSEMSTHKRWIELAVHHSTARPPNVERFFTSVQTGTKTGKQVGKGSKSIVGDPIEGASQGRSETNRSAEMEPARVIFRPYPRLPPGLLRSKIDGSVKLKIELKANGTVGDITTVQEPSREASMATIEMAREMVFLPMMVNGVPTDSIFTLDFEFSFNSGKISN